MNLLTLISQEILTATPHIEADLDGCWRLEERHLISLKGSKLVYRRNPDEPCALGLRIDKDTVTHLSGNDLTDERWSCQFEFDPQTALIHHPSDHHYLRIEQLTARTMTLLDLQELGSGILVRERFERM